MSRKHIFRRTGAFFSRHCCICLFLLIYIGISFLTYKDYGPTSDEKVEYDTGKYLLEYYTKATDFEYVNELVTNEPSNIIKRQLPLFSTYSRIYPALLTILNPGYYFEWFHLQNMVFGSVLFVTAYLLLFLVYKDQKKAITAPVLLLLTPIVYGHIPANPKDIPFSILYLLGTYLIARNLKKSENAPNLPGFLLLGMVFGLATGIRIVGLTLIITYFLAGAAKIIKNGAITNKLFDHFTNTGIILIISLFFWIITVPFLGANFFANLVFSLSNSADFQYWNGKILYLGDFFGKDERPWHYLFVHLSLQLPLVVIAGILFGGFFMFRKKIKFDVVHPASILIISILLNIVIYLIFQPVVYNSARHYLFLVVSLVVLTGFFSIEVYKILSKKKKVWLVGSAAGYLFFTLIRMVHLHPYEYIYYNELVGGLRGAEQKYELDYWGAAYKESAEIVTSIIEKNNLENVKVYSCNNQFAVVYYSHFRYNLVSRSKASDIILCDTVEEQFRIREADAFSNETHPVMKTIYREGIPIHKIRATETFVKYFN